MNRDPGPYSTMDYPRINQFPEWFTADRDAEYQLVSTKPEPNGRYTGEELIAGQICYIILEEIEQVK